MSAITSQIKSYDLSAFYRSTADKTGVEYGKQRVQPFTINQPINVYTLAQPLVRVLKTLEPKGQNTWSNKTADFEFPSDTEEVGEAWYLMDLSMLPIVETVQETYADYPGLILLQKLLVYTDKTNEAIVCTDFIQWVLSLKDELPKGKLDEILAAAGGKGFTGGRVVIPLGLILPWCQYSQGGKVELQTLPVYNLKTNLHFLPTWRLSAECVSAGVTTVPTFASTPQLYYYEYISDKATLDSKKGLPFSMKCLVPDIIEYTANGSAGIPSGSNTTIDISSFNDEFASLNIIIKNKTEVEVNHNYYDCVNINKKVELFMDRNSHDIIERNNGTEDITVLRKYMQALEMSKFCPAVSNVHKILRALPCEPNMQHDSYMGGLYSDRYKDKSIIIRQDSGSAVLGYVVGMSHAKLEIVGDHLVMSYE